MPEMQRNSFVPCISDVLSKLLRGRSRDGSNGWGRGVILGRNVVEAPLHSRFSVLVPIEGTRGRWPWGLCTL